LGFFSGARQDAQACLVDLVDSRFTNYPHRPPGHRPGGLPPDRQDDLRAAIKAGIAARRNLNPPRRHRTYPRMVKRARHNSYRVKRASDQGIRHAGPPAIKLANLGWRSLTA
jgi:hypothetical protein